jgi:hypothetical protein
MAAVEHWRARVTRTADSATEDYFCAVDATGKRRTISGGGTPMELGIDQSAPIRTALDDAVRRYYQGSIPAKVEIEGTELGPGEYYPRVWRGEHGPAPVEVCEAVWSDGVAAARALFAEMRTAFRYVEPHPSNLGTFSHELRQLLILACTELEAAWKGILGGGGSTEDYVRLMGPLHLDEWEVSLALYPRVQPFRPFRGWHNPKTTGVVPGGPTGPSQTLPWYKGYNDTKHDRATRFDQASLEHVIYAMGAVHVMLCAQFGTWWGSGRQPVTNTPKFMQHVVFRDLDFVIRNEPTWSVAEAYLPREVGGPSTTWTPARFTP